MKKGDTVGFTLGAQYQALTLHGASGSGYAIGASPNDTAILLCDPVHNTASEKWVLVKVNSTLAAVPITILRELE